MKYLILLHSMYRSPLPTLPTGRQAAGRPNRAFFRFNKKHYK